MIFGQRKFLLKTYSLSELGLPTDVDTSASIAIYQKYFHICFIPIFGTGQQWSLKKGDALFEMPFHYQQSINKLNIESKTSLWAYTGLLLVIGFYVLMFSSEYFSSRAAFQAHLKAQKVQLKIERDTCLKRFETLKVADLLFFEMLPLQGLPINYNFGKIKSITNDSVQIYMFNRVGSPDFRELQSFQMEHQLATARNAHVIQLSKSVLKQAICLDENESSKCQGISMNPSLQSLFRLKSIEYFEPFYLEMVESYIEGILIRIQFQVKGEPATILRINSLENVAWSQITKKNGQTISKNGFWEISGLANDVKKPYLFEIICQDMQNNTQRFLVEGRMTKEKGTITRL